MPSGPLSSISRNLCSRRSISCRFSSAFVLARPHLGLGVTGPADCEAANVVSAADIAVTTFILPMPSLTDVATISTDDDKDLLRSAADILLKFSAEVLPQSSTGDDTNSAELGDDGVLFRSTVGNPPLFSE